MTTNPAALAAWKHLYDRVNAWNPTHGVAAAEQLLHDLEQLPEPGKVPEADASEVFGLKKVQTLLRREPDKRDVKLDVKYVDHPIYRVLAVRDDVTWPWADLDAEVRTLDTLDDTRAFEESWARARLARAVAQCAWTANAPDPRGALQWLERTFLLRTRPHWLPSAVALADLLASPLRSTPWGAHFESVCKQNAMPPAKGAEERNHHARHYFVVATLTAAKRAEGTFGGTSADAWRALATNYEACAALTAAYRLAGMLDPAVRALEEAQTRFARSFTYQIWHEARQLLGDPALTTPEVVAAALLDAIGTDRDIPLLAGDFYDAGLTLRELRARNDRTEAIARLLAGRLRDAPQVVNAINVTAQDWLPLTRATLDDLAPDVWEASPPVARAATLAAVFHLVESPHAAAADWPSLACGHPWLHARPGKVREAARLDLFILAAKRDATFTALLHARIDGTEAVGPRHTATFDGLASLLRGRWRRDEQASSGPQWKVLPNLTQAAGTQIVRRLVAAGDDSEAVGRVLLAVLSEDAPTWNHREIASNGARDTLWSFVNDWLPDLASTAPLRPVLAELVAMETRRTTADIDTQAGAFDTVLASFPAFAAVAEPTRRSAKLAGDALRHAPRLTQPDGWKMGETDLPATPRAMRAWWHADIRELARALADAGAATSAALLPAPKQGTREKPEAALGAALRLSLLERVMEVERADVPDVEAPHLDPPTLTIWREGLAALRTLAEPLPWHVEAELDASIRACEDWLAAAADGAIERGQLIHSLRQAMQAGNEATLDDLQPRDIQLLDSAFLRKIGHFYLRRLRFDGARKLPERAGVPSPTSYFAPLLFAVIGAPLNAMQTKDIWEPVLASFPGGKYASVVLLLTFVCVYTLIQDARHRLPGTGLEDFLKRVIPPLLALYALNVATNAFVFWLVDPASGRFQTIALWSSLSLYLGLFIGLIAQGQKIDEDDDSV